MNTPASKKVIAVCGPTASGKSDVAMRLAEKFGGEIVGCDSMQIYRGMDVGTAKPTRSDMARIRHHMIDIIDPSESYSCAEYASDAAVCVDDILSRGKLPVICGGTGLYLESLLFEHPFDSNPGRGPIREELEKFAAEQGAHALWETLREIDPESAAAIHENNVRRVIRAIEIYKTTGIRKSETDKIGLAPRYDALVLYLKTTDRKKREERIRRRAEQMFAQGLCEETAALLRAGVFEANSTAAGAIGYKETIGFVAGQTTRSEALSALIVSTRQYAKRQDTWFDRRSYATPVAADGDADPYIECEKLVSAFLGSSDKTDNG